MAAMSGKAKRVQKSLQARPLHTGDSGHDRGQTPDMARGDVSVRATGRSGRLAAPDSRRRRELFHLLHGDVPVAEQPEGRGHTGDGEPEADPEPVRERVQDGAFPRAGKSGEDDEVAGFRVSG